MMARSRRPLLFPAVLILVLAAAFLFFAVRSEGLPFVGFFAPQRSSASWSILEEIRDLEELETASYDMKVVFPYDFTGDDEVDWRELKFQYDSAPDYFAAKADPSWHPGGILPPEWKHAALYDLCRRSGIDPGRPDHRFVVMTVSVRAGIDLAAWIDGFEERGPREEVGGIEVTESDDGRRTLSLAAPPVAVTSFIVEDRDTGAEGFPDVPLSPDEWRSLVDELEPRLRQMALGGGLTDRAEQEGRAFLNEIFKAAGYDDVVFTS